MMRIATLTRIHVSQAKLDMKEKNMLALAGSCALIVSANSFIVAVDIVGNVTDASGQALSGSKNCLADQSGRTLGDTVTDQSGRYAIEDLRPGLYNIKLEPASSNLKGDTAVGYVDARASQ
jgi:uncharacterized surface anchored protein